MLSQYLFSIFDFMKLLPISFAFHFSVFLMACSTPTVSSDETDEKSSSSEELSSSSIAIKAIINIYIINVMQIVLEILFI